LFKTAIPNGCEQKNKTQTVEPGVFHRFPSPYYYGLVYFLKIKIFLSSRMAVGRFGTVALCPWL
jgi:hypothetical protein